MKRYLLVLCALLCSIVPAHAQQARRTFTTSSVAADSWVREIGSGVQFHQVTWAKSGTVSTCQIQIDFSNDGVTSAGTVISSQLCTSNGQSTIIGPSTFNYVRINVTTQSGGGSTTGTYLGFTSAQSSGGGVTGCSTTGGVLYQNGTANTGTCNPNFVYSPTATSFMQSVNGSDSGVVEVNLGGAGHPLTQIGSTTGGLGAAMDLDAATQLTHFGPGGNNYSTAIFSQSIGAGFPIAGSGIYRLSKAGNICWRNNANGADICLAINAVDQLTYSGVPISVIGPSFSTGAVTQTTNVLLGLTQNNTLLASFYLASSTSVVNTVAYDVTLADATANVYDIGLYGPGCVGGAASVPLVLHSGPQAGTVLFPSTGSKTFTPVGSPLTVNMVPGWYCVAYTSSGATPAGRIGGESSSGHLVVFANATAPGGGTGTTSAGTLNNTITAPALASIVVGAIWFTGF